MPRFYLNTRIACLNGAVDAESQEDALRIVETVLSNLDVGGYVDVVLSDAEAHTLHLSFDPLELEPEDFEED